MAEVLTLLDQGPVPDSCSCSHSSCLGRSRGIGEVVSSVDLLVRAAWLYFVFMNIRPKQPL